MKLLLKLFIAMIALLFAVIALLLILVDPNDYKDEIQTQVKSSINRDLHINGDIGWTFYPQLGFSSGEIVLDNLASFDKPQLLKINQASLAINILPLLKGEISVGKLTLDGFELTLLTDKNGLSNLDNMGADKRSTTNTVKPETTSPEKAQNQESFFAINKTQLAGIDINNAIIELQDLQAGSYQKITINEIKLGQFALDKETTLSINTKVIIDDVESEIKLNTLLAVNTELNNIKLNKLQIDSTLTADALPNGQLTSQLKTDIDVALESKIVTLKGLDIKTVVNADNLPNKKISTQFNADINYQLENQLATLSALKLKVDNIELAGDVSVQTSAITKVRYDLVANQWDLNPYITKTSDEETSTANTSKSSGSITEKQAEVEPDLAFLHDLDIDGKLTIAGVKIDNINIGEVKKRLIIKHGKAQLKPLTAELYQGFLTVNGQVDDSKGRNKYQLSTSLKDVQLHQLLIDAAEIDLLSGKTNFSFTGKGQGLTSTKIQQGLVGKGDFTLLDGELYGVNIPQEIRILKAKITGKKPPTSDNIKKTDFASLIGNFTIDKGLVNNQKLQMLSPVMRLDGSGLINILTELLDYKLSISPLSKSKAETDYVDLNGLSIPMLIKGSFTDPKISLDTDGALKEQLKAKAKALEKEAKVKLKAEQKRLKQRADKELKKYQDDLDAETQEKIKKETKRFEDKLSKYF